MGPRSPPRKLPPKLSARELRWVCGGRGENERASRGPGDRPVTLPREARQGGGRPPQWPGAASTPRTARRGSGGRRPARLSCNTRQGLGLLGVTRAAAFWSSGKTRGPTCRATPMGSNVPQASPPCPRAGSHRRGGVRAGSAHGASPALRVRGRKRDRPRPGTRPEPGGRRCQDAPRASPRAGPQGPRGARPLSRRLPGGGAHWQGKKSRAKETIIRDDAFVGIFIANLGAF